jgi:transposase
VLARAARRSRAASGNPRREPRSTGFGINAGANVRGTKARKAHPFGVADDTWSLAVPYLTLMRANAAQRQRSLRELFNGLRYVIRYGIAWRAMPNDLPPWFGVCQQSRCWLAAGCVEALAQDLCAVLRLRAGSHESGDRPHYSVSPVLCHYAAETAIDGLAKAQGQELSGC